MNRKINFYLLLVALVFMLAGISVAEPSKSSTEQTVTVVTANSPASSDQVMEDPVKMLEGVTGNVLHALQEHKGNTDINSIYDLCNKYILPYVDFNEMSVWIAGRTVWGKASEQSRDQFIDAFKVLVVRTYATALKSYTNEKVEFGPQHYDANKQRIQITSTIVRSNGNNVHLLYRLVKNDNKWFVYDIIIEGVSILQGFQAQFSDDIRQNGLQKVTAQIEEHNRQRNA